MNYRSPLMTTQIPRVKTSLQLLQKKKKTTTFFDTYRKSHLKHVNVIAQTNHQTKWQLQTNYDRAQRWAIWPKKSYLYAQGCIYLIKNISSNNMQYSSK